MFGPLPHLPASHGQQELKRQEKKLYLHWAVVPCSCQIIAYQDIQFSLCAGPSSPSPLQILPPAGIQHLLGRAVQILDVVGFSAGCAVYIGGKVHLHRALLLAGFVCADFQFLRVCTRHCTPLCAGKPGIINVWSTRKGP